MYHNKSAFTLIEMLATIIILGLLFTLAYVGVRTVLDRGNDSYYDSQENMLILAGREYFADYRSELPKEIGETATVPAETLIDESYIDPIKDKDGNDCDFVNSGVTVQKITEKDYQYYSILKCSNYETEKDKEKPMIAFSPNASSSNSSITVTMSITDNVEVTKYRYVIEKDGETYQDSGSKMYSGNETINLTEKGLYRITGYAYDSSGNLATRRSGVYSVYEGIDCSSAEITSSSIANTWINSNATLNIKLPNNTYRYEIYTKLNSEDYQLINSYIGSQLITHTFSEEGSNQLRVTVYDSKGNSCNVTSGIYRIDKTPPVITSIAGNPGCVTSPTTISINLQAKEEGSGIAKWQYGYSQDKMIDYANSASTSFTTTPFSAVRNQPAYFRTCDKAGNCSSFGSTNICIKAGATISGNTGKWQVIFHKRSSCDAWAACEGTVYGNIIGKVDVSYSNSTGTINWTVKQGPETWIRYGYYVKLVVNKNGSEYKTYTLKAENDPVWAKGSTHSGNMSLTLEKGTYTVYLQGNSTNPSFNAEMATIVVN